MRDKLLLDEAQLRERLLILAGEHGPEVLEASADDLEQLCLSHATYHTVGATPEQILKSAQQVMHYGLLASLARRADDLNLDRMSLRSETLFNEAEEVPLDLLRRNARVPLFKIGQRVYMPASGSDTVEEDEDPVVGCMEVIVAGYELSYDYVQYQIGQLRPDGIMVDLIGEWVDESELYADMDSVTEAIVGTRPAQPKMRPRLSVVKD